MRSAGGAPAPPFLAAGFLVAVVRFADDSAAVFLAEFLAAVFLAAVFLAGFFSAMDYLPPLAGAAAAGAAAGAAAAGALPGIGVVLSSLRAPVWPRNSR